MKIPKRIIVKELLSSRYSGLNKPLIWNERTAGVDVVKDLSDNDYKLESEGSQSSPQPGWEIMLTGTGKIEGQYKWTLYGIRS